MMMRYLVLAILTCGVLQTGFSQKNLQYFIKDLETTDEYTHVKIPTKVIQKGIKLHIQKPEVESNLNKLASGIIKANVYTTQILDMDENKILQIINGHKKKIVQKDDFLEWVNYQEKDENTSLLILEKEEKIIKILILNQKKFEVRLYEFLTEISRVEFEKLKWHRELKRF